MSPRRPDLNECNAEDLSLRNRTGRRDLLILKLLHRHAVRPVPIGVSFSRTHFGTSRSAHICSECCTLFHDPSPYRTCSSGRFPWTRCYPQQAGDLSHRRLRFQSPQPPTQQGCGRNCTRFVPREPRGSLLSLRLRGSASRGARGGFSKPPPTAVSRAQRRMRTRLRSRQLRSRPIILPPHSQLVVYIMAGAMWGSNLHH